MPILLVPSDLPKARVKKMKPWIMVMPALTLVSSGCTMMSLERHTIAQNSSAVDVRYREIVDNLAIIANDRSRLPNYSSIFVGTIFVQDQGQLISTTTWPFSVGMQATNPSGNRQISQNWALDPIMAPEKLEAIRAACQWVIGGPDYVSKDSMSLLISPEEAPPGSARHFGVAKDLAKLPEGWLRIGCSRDVPKCARYKAHFNQTWVWVMPDAMKGLDELSLIIQSIARVYINSPTLFNLPAYFAPLTFLTSDTDPDDRFRFAVTANVDQSGHLQTTLPYIPLRIETTGVDANLRSLISAAGISSVPH
ncbi:MAG: hypothetical protein ACRELG_06830 [Gemmataceae bacterium]